MPAKKEYHCPYWDKHECKETFQSAEEASFHAIKDHNVTPLHVRQDGRFLCYHAGDFGRSGCRKVFQYAADANQHVADFHEPKGIPLPCPFSELEDCDYNGFSPFTLWVHVNKCHRGYEYPCQHCDKVYKCNSSLWVHVRDRHSDYEHFCSTCNRKFNTRSGLRAHIKSAHEEVKHPCPYKDDPAVKCTKKFATHNYAQKHAQVEHEEQEKEEFPCPGAIEYECARKFSEKGNAARHYKSVHLHLKYECKHCGKKVHSQGYLNLHEAYHTHKFKCPRHKCHKRFKTHEEALSHAEDPSHPSGPKLYACPCPNCHMTVVGKGLNKEQLKGHWSLHLKHGHVSPDVKLTFTRMERLQFRRLSLYDRIYQHTMEHAGEIDTDLENGNAVIAEEDPDFEEAEEEEDEEEYLDAMDAPDIELLEIKSDETSTVDHRSLILSLNTEWWERQRDFKVKLQTRGLTCRGPGLGSRLIITEPCPGQVTIDLDTALLRRPGGLRSAHMLSLQGRCIECNAARKAKILLKVLDTPVFRSRNIDFAPLGKRLDISIRDKWSCPDNYKEMVLERIEEIKNKERPGTDLVVLDDEFSLLSDRQLWEFSIIERVSGKVLIDTLVKHDRQAKQSSLWNKPVFKNLRAMNERHRQSVYSRRGRLQKLDVHEIAKRLKETGITPDSIVLMWHLYQFDLQLPRNFLAKAGYHNMLPGDENCIPLIPIYRSNLPNGQFIQKFPLNLEIVHPVLHPESDLRGLNHRAVIDCLQTRDACESLDQFLKPVEERGEAWKPGKFAKGPSWFIRKHFYAEADIPHDELNKRVVEIDEDRSTEDDELNTQESPTKKRKV